MKTDPMGGRRRGEGRNERSRIKADGKFSFKAIRDLDTEHRNREMLNMGLS